MTKKKNITRIVNFTVLFFWLMPPIYAQNSTVNFLNIGVKNGMTSNWVTALCRDSEGLMWIGTNLGLNSFDGYNITMFERKLGDTTSLSNGLIWCIAEDKKQNLWVGTTNGLNIKKPGATTFKQVSLFDYNAFGCNDINNINEIYVAKNGEVFIGTHQGFFIYADGHFHHHLIDSSRFDADLNNIFSFAGDLNGNIWMGTFSRELVCYEKNTGEFDFIPLPGLFEGKYVSGLQKLFIDSDNLLWIGSQSGMYVYDLQKREWHSQLNQLFFDRVGKKIITGIQEDHEGSIWISTDGAGIFIYKKKDREILNLVHRQDESGSISTNGIYCLRIDEDDIVWVGTYKKGLDFYKRSLKKFRLIRNHPDEENTLSSNDINCCTEDFRGNIWIGTNSSGISIFNRDTGLFKKITVANSGANGLSSDIVVSLFEDHQKNMWIGTYFGGLNKYNPRTGKFTVYKHNIDDTTSISDDRIWSISEDANNNLWVGTLGGGLNMFDTEKEAFIRYNEENSGLIGNYVNYISSDRRKRLWICTSDGLSIYNIFKNEFETYINKNPAGGTSEFGPVVSCYEDSRGWHWLCSNNGLIKFDPVAHTSVLIDKKSGLLSNATKRILEDEQGNLWVSSSSGITKISFTDIINDTTFTVNFMHFDETNGLQGHEFSETASLKTRDGEMLFAGVNGLNIFNPNEIKTDRTIPKLIFTNLRIFNSVISPGEEFGNRVILDKPINYIDEIVLKYSENLFSIEFAALTYLFPEKNKYRYQLEGFDENWFETDGKTNFATFTNLNNGDYTLHVKGSNADGTWNEQGISIKIKVLPPFWKSWYAILIYVLLISLLLFLLRYMILFRGRLKIELNMERAEAKRVHELDMLKLKFFTNISHELRTPLTLILSPTENLLVRFKNLPEEKYIQHIYKNSKKLLTLINQLLDFRKMEDQGLSYNPSWGNIVDFISGVVASFNDLSENKNIELRLVTELREFNMMFDKDKLEKILYNLLSNAFKYTQVSGVVSVQIGLEDVHSEGANYKKSNLLMKVKDNGIGIHPDEIDKIFNRFYQGGNPNFSETVGSGIGLALTKEYVHLHGGAISVDSAQNIGTCFTVRLPVVGNSSTPDNIFYGKTKETRFNTPPKELNSKEKTTNSDKPVVFIVEDNQDLRNYLKENLEERYEIIEAANGKHALVLLEDKLPDLILSDIMMPVMDGVEFCEKVKNNKITSHIPFIFLTAKTSEQQKLEGLKTGADDYIAKPFNLDIVKTKIQNLVQLRQNIREVFRTKIQIEPKDISITSLDEKFMAKALDIVEKEMGNPEFTVAGFSKFMGISRMQLYNKIVALTGSTPLEFIRILRLKRAAQLLTKGQLNVSEVAYKVGFNDPKYFSIQFKKEFHVPPSKYGKG